MVAYLGVTLYAVTVVLYVTVVVCAISLVVRAFIFHSERSK